MFTDDTYVLLTDVADTETVNIAIVVPFSGREAVNEFSQPDLESLQLLAIVRMDT